MWLVNLFHVYIYGDQNIVATGEQVTQHVTTVQQGDSESLLSCLRSLNVEDADLNLLQDAIENEPTAPEGEYGPKVKAWLGEMVAKAATGTWKVGLEAGTKMLADALNQYYEFVTGSALRGYQDNQSAPSWTAPYGNTPPSS